MTGSRRIAHTLTLILWRAKLCRAADGSGGGAATLGYDSHARLTPLTTDFHEFIAQVSSENAEVLQYGPFFQWSDKVRQEHNVPMGPLNPQALNRYSYVLNNPLRYVDPTGHDGWVVLYSQYSKLLTEEQVRDFKKEAKLFVTDITIIVAAAVGTITTNGWVGAGAAIVMNHLLDDYTSLSQEGDWNSTVISFNQQTGEYRQVETTYDAQGNVLDYRYMQSYDGEHWWTVKAENYIDKDHFPTRFSDQP